MRVLIFSMLTLLVMSCGGEEMKQPKTKKKSNITVPTERFDLYAINGVMSLPDYYKRVNFKEYKEICSGIVTNPINQKRGLQRLDYLEQNFPAYNIFVDETNYLNSVVLFPLDANLPINQMVGQELIKKIERDFSKLYRYGDFDYKRMQAKKSSMGSTQYLKLRYLISNKAKDNQYFTTCYLFTADRYTFMIWGESQEDEDFENYIQTLTIGR